MKTVLSSDLKCGSCVSKVRPHLDAIDDIQSWNVDTTNSRKLITIDHSSAAAIEQAQAGIQAAGFQSSVLTPNEAKLATQQSTKPKSPGFDISNYKPLALVLLYVIGLTIYSEWLARGFEWSRVMSFFMGYFFLAFAFFKLLNVSAFATAFASYDIIAAKSRAYGLAYPWIELSLGLLYLWPATHRGGFVSTLANSATAVIMSIGLVGVVQAVRKKTSHPVCVSGDGV